MGNQGDGALSVVDPITHEITGAIPVGTSPLGLAADPGLRKLYVTDSVGGDLWVVDAETGEVTPVAVGTGAGFPAVNPNNRLVYVPLAGGSVAVVNGFNDQLLSFVPVGGTPTAATVNPRTNLVYIANGTNTVPVINSNTNATFAEVSLPDGLAASDVADDPCNNCVYVLCGDGSVAVINGSSNAVREVFRPGEGADAIALDPGLGLIYLASGGQVLVYDMCTLDEVGALDLGLPAGARPRRVAVNGITHLVYVTDTEGTVHVADGGANTQVNAFPGGAQPFDVAVLNCEPPCPSCGGPCCCDSGATGAAAFTRPGGDVRVGTAYAFVANQDGTLSVLNPRTHALEDTLAVGTRPFGVAADPALGLVYVTDEAESAIYAVDAATRGIIKKISLPGGARLLAVNPATHMVYVPGFDANTLAVIDGTAVRGSAALFDTVAVGGMPCAVAVNPHTNRIYVANAGSGAVTVVNGNTGGALAEIPVAGAGIGTLTDVAADPCANRIYAADFGGDIAVIDGRDNTVAGHLEGGACALALDGALGLLYAVDETRAGVSVYDTRTGLRITRIPLGGGARLARVAADCDNHLAYVTDEGGLATHVIDGVTRTLISSVAARGGTAAPMGVATLAQGDGAPAQGEMSALPGGSLRLTPRMLEALRNREPLKLELHLCGQREGGETYLMVNMVNL